MTNFSRILNIALRGGTLAAKFSLLAIMAILMPPGEVGQYGLLTAAIGWTMYLVGWEFYTFSMREIIAQGPNRVRDIVRNKIALYATTYIFISPVVILVFATDILPSRYGIWFAVLLVLEHLGLEAGRVLLSLSRPLLSSIMLFLRGGAWCIAAIGAMLTLPELRHLDFVLASWSVGSSIGLMVGLASLYHITDRSTVKAVDWRWIGKGLSVALPLMVASLSVRGMFTIDRIWVEWIGGADVLGAYVLFIGVATAILSFIDAGIVDFAYPRIVLAAKTGKIEEFRREMRRLEWSVGAAVVILSIGCWLGFAMFVRLLPNPIYEQKLGLLVPIILAMALYGVSSVPHLALYAHHQDRTIVVSQLVALAVFLGAASLLAPLFGVASVPIALVAAFTIIVLWKSVAYLSLQDKLLGK